MMPFHEDREPPSNFWTWLKKRKRMHQEGHEDTVIVVCGGEQIGKSRFTLRTEWCLFQDKFLIDGKYMLDPIVFNGEDYRYAATHTSKTIVHDDEAITHFYSRQAMTPENIKCNQVLAQCGYKHNITFILIPNFFVLDTYLREHRVHAIVKIYRNNKFKAWVFSKNKKKLEKINKKKAFAVNCSSKGWWSEDDDTDEFRKFVKMYRKKEDEQKRKSGEKIQVKEEKPKTEKEIIIENAVRSYREGKGTLIQVSKIHGIGRMTLIRHLKKQNTTIPNT